MITTALTSGKSTNSYSEIDDDVSTGQRNSILTGTKDESAPTLETHSEIKRRQKAIKIGNMVSRMSEIEEQESNNQISGGTRTVGNSSKKKN